MTDMIQNYNFGVDIDNTLTNESPYDTAEGFEIILYKILNCDIKPGIDILKTKDLNIFLITGRTEKYRTATIEWLKNNEIPFSLLIMPPDNIYPNNVWNKEAYISFKLRAYINNHISFALDDDPDIVNILNLWDIKASKVNGNFAEAFNNLFR